MIRNLPLGAHESPITGEYLHRRDKQVARKVNAVLIGRSVR
jgi:hypothetical protein